MLAPYQFFLLRGALLPVAAFITPTIINNPDDLSDVTQRNKQAAEKFMTEEMRSALPAEFITQPALQEDRAEAAPADM